MHIFSLLRFGSNCTWTDLCPSDPTDDLRGNDFEKIELMTMAASFVVEAPLGCLDDRCGHFDHNTITEDISLSSAACRHVGFMSALDTGVMS